MSSTSDRVSQVLRSPFLGLVWPVLGLLIDSYRNELTVWPYFVTGLAHMDAVLLWENFWLKRASHPRLTLVFEPDKGAPYFEDRRDGERSYERIYKVGLRNTGDSVYNVRVLLRAFTPAEGAVQIKNPLTRMESGETTVDVHKGDQPMVFFDLFTQRYGDADAHNPPFAHRPEIGLATGYLVALRTNAERYKLALEIDGPNAGPPLGLIYKRDKRGVYTLAIDDFSRL